MTRLQRLSQLIILCRHCIRNYAFFRAGWKEDTPIFKGDFWLTSNLNYINICVIQWCIIFDKLLWENNWGIVISDQKAFWDGMQYELGISEAGFSEYVLKMCAYRDKIVSPSHHEEIPDIDFGLAQRSIAYLYDYVLKHEGDGNRLIGSIDRSEGHYGSCVRQAKGIYQVFENQTD